MADTEEYFPRGGKKPTLTHFKQSANFLGAPEKSEKKKRKSKKKSDGDDGYLSDEGTKEVDQSTKNCGNGITKKTIREGLLILARVRNIIDTKLGLSLPNRISCSLMACHISESYNKLLEAYVNDQVDKVTELRNLFRAGQYIAVKVLEVKENEILVSTMPQHVNGGKKHADLHKGLLMQAAVSSVEDHGYVMDLGVPNTRAFLPSKHVNPDISLEVGMVTWCAVLAVEQSAAHCIVSLSSELAALQDSWLRQKTPAPLLPGNAVEFVVDTPLENGIEGHVFGDTVAYVQRAHAEKVKGKKPKLGQKVRARVLYVMPTRNTLFLTLKNIFETTYPDLAEEQVLKDGDIIDEAQVVKISGRSIVFRLPGGCAGAMSVARVPVHDELSDEQVVAKSYPVGSKHRVRVLCYYPSDYMYAVSDQPEVLRERYFSLPGVAVGQLVDATVREVADSHVLLTVGRMRGFVPQTHLSDSGIYIDPKKSSNSKLSKKKFKVGQEVKARVLSKDEMKSSLILTLKPSLLTPDLEVLQSVEQAEIGKAYTGVITLIRHFILVTFFDNVKAYVLKRHVSKEPLDNIADAFHLGQIVNCTILQVDIEAKKMSGSLVTAPFWPAKKDKRQNIDLDEIPNKKHKNSEQTEVKQNKKQKKAKTEEIAEEPDSEYQNDSKESKKDKKKKKKQKEQQENAEDEQEHETSVDKKNKKKKNKLEPERKDSVDSGAGETDVEEDEDMEDQPDVPRKTYTLEQLEVGQIVDATVNNVTNNHVLISVGRVRGCVPKIHLPDSENIDHKPKENFKVGQKVKARVLWKEPTKSSLYLTLKPSLLAPDLEVLQSVEQAEIGKAYTGVITIIQDYVLVTFFNRVAAYVPKQYVSKAALANIADAVHVGQIVNCTMLRVDKNTRKMSGSLVTKPFWPAKKREHAEKRRHENDGSEEITNKKPKKSNVEKNAEESDKDCKERKKDKKKKKGKGQEETIVEQTFSEESDAIETDVYEDTDQILTPLELKLIDLSQCTKPFQYIRKIKSLGENITKGISRVLKLEQKIAKIEEKGLDADNKKFHSSMHAEKAVVEQRIKKVAEAMEIAQAKVDEIKADDRKASKDDQKDKTKTKRKKKQKNDNEQVDVKEEDKSAQVKLDKAKNIKVFDSLEPALEAPSVKDFWSTNSDTLTSTAQNEESSSSEEEEQDQPKKKRKKLTVAEKVAKAREEEEQVREMERRAIESEGQPRSSDQFERALLANPNCSQLWIAYMAFHLQATEVEKARAVGRRALASIAFREEQEKLNVWLAMINFENRFGTKESQQKTLEEALQTNEPYQVHCKLLDMYVDTGKQHELSALVDLMVRKYKREPAAYMACGAACFKLGLVDKARQVMQKAIAVLEKKEHVSVLVKFALLERSAGGRERAEALFEQVLAVYPARVDVAATYVDMLLKTSDIEHIRQVLERMTTQKLPARKMKVLYKKWIEVEEKIGDEEQVEKIKQRAMEYIEKAKF